MASIAASTRLRKEQAVLADSREGFTAGPATEDDILLWKASITPDESSLFAGATLPIELKFPENYPFRPPTVRFTCDVWHPNVAPDGTVHISILEVDAYDDVSSDRFTSEQWTPGQNVRTIMLSLLAILDTPDVEMASNVDAARMWKEDPEAYNRTVRETVERLQSGNVQSS